MQFGIFAVLVLLGCEANTSEVESANSPHENILATMLDYERNGDLVMAAASESQPSEIKNSLVREDDLLSGMPRVVVDLDNVRRLGLDGQTVMAAGATNVEASHSKDLRSFDTAIRSQGSIGSCTAFSVVAAIENLANQNNRKLNLSEQHLWNTQRRQPSLIASMRAASGTLLLDEGRCPYQGCSAAGRVSGGVATVGEVTYYESLSGIVRALRAGQPVSFATPTSHWENQYYHRGGVINSRVPKDGYAHAVAVVGYAYDERFPGGGYLIFKNSWWTSWGDRGYGYLPFGYCRTAYCVGYGVEKATFANGASISPDDGADNSAEDNTDDNSNNNSDNSTPSTTLKVRVEIGEADGRYRSFRLYLQGTPGALNTVESVTFGTHETFGDYAQIESSDRANKFRSLWLKTYASGWTTATTIIKLKSGKTLEVPGADVNF
jgi:C1A family cysteine protease